MAVAALDRRTISVKYTWNQNKKLAINSSLFSSTLSNIEISFNCKVSCTKILNTIDALVWLCGYQLFKLSFSFYLITDFCCAIKSKRWPNKKHPLFLIFLAFYCHKTATRSAKCSQCYWLGPIYFLLLVQIGHSVNFVIVFTCENIRLYISWVFHMVAIVKINFRGNG